MIGLDLGRISEVVSSGGQEEQPMVKQKALRQLRLMHIGLRESQPLFDCCSHPVKRISSRKKGAAGTLSQQARNAWKEKAGNQDLRLGVLLAPMKTYYILHKQIEVPVNDGYFQASTDTGYR